MVEGILMAVDNIAANGQNVQHVMQAPYGGVAADPATNYRPTVAVVRQDNTEVYHPQGDVTVPEARSGLSRAAWDTSAQTAETTARLSLDAILQHRINIGNALTQIADEAGLRAMGPQQAMQAVLGLVGTLNTTGNMATTIKPSDLYDTVRRLAMVVELMQPQPPAGAQAQPNPVLEGLNQCLAANRFMAQRRQDVQYQLPTQTAATVMLAQYAIR